MKLSDLIITSSIARCLAGQILSESFVYGTISLITSFVCCRSIVFRYRFLDFLINLLCHISLGWSWRHNPETCCTSRSSLETSLHPYALLSDPQNQIFMTEVKLKIDLCVAYIYVMFVLCNHTFLQPRSEGLMVAASSTVSLVLQLLEVQPWLHQKFCFVKLLVPRLIDLQGQKMHRCCYNFFFRISHPHKFTRAFYDWKNSKHDSKWKEGDIYLLVTLNWNKKMISTYFYAVNTLACRDHWDRYRFPKPKEGITFLIVTSLYPLREFFFA